MFLCVLGAVSQGEGSVVYHKVQEALNTLLPGKRKCNVEERGLLFYLVSK